MPGDKGLKATPLTVGGLVLLLGLVGTVGAWIMANQDSMETQCKKVITGHRDSDVDRAHPDMQRRYVPRAELGNKLHKIDRRLDKMDSMQRTILTEVKNGHGRRRGRRSR